MEKGIICIIEDNKSIAKLFAIVLQKSGYKVVEFYDAKKCFYLA